MKNFLRTSLTTVLAILIACFVLPATAGAQNVGIGTNSPAQKLDVEGYVELGDENVGATGTDGAIRYNTGGFLEYYHGGSWNPVDGSDNDWQDAGTGQMHLGNAGDNVGIKTTTPTAPLQVGAISGTSGQFDAVSIEANNSGGKGYIRGIAVNTSADDGGSESQTDVKIGRSKTYTTDNNNKAIGVDATAYSNEALASFCGAYGIRTKVEASGGTYDMTNANCCGHQKFTGITATVDQQSEVLADAEDVVASVYGKTGHHNNGGAIITGPRLYAGLFQGNASVVGLRGENSAYIDLWPDWQSDQGSEGVIGFYGTSNDGGSNGSGDDYLSIEAWADPDSPHSGASSDNDVVLQDRSSGNVGINTSSPSRQLEVGGDVRIGGLSGGSTRNVQVEADGDLVTGGGGGGDNDWTVSGGDTYLTNSGSGENVGINTSSPTKAHLHIVGRTDQRLAHLEGNFTDVSGSLSGKKGFASA